MYRIAAGCTCGGRFPSARSASKTARTSPAANSSALNQRRAGSGASSGPGVGALPNAGSGAKVSGAQASSSPRTGPARSVGMIVLTL